MGPLDFDYAAREGHQFYMGPRLPMLQGVIMAAIYTYWTPLTDDGDALRLAVKLQFDISHNHPADQELWVCVDYLGSKGTVFVEVFDDESLRLAATRRVIFRAAAEIGKAL